MEPTLQAHAFNLLVKLQGFCKAPLAGAALPWCCIVCVFCRLTSSLGCSSRAFLGQWNERAAIQSTTVCFFHVPSPSWKLPSKGCWWLLPANAVPVSVQAQAFGSCLPRSTTCVCFMPSAMFSKSSKPSKYSVDVAVSRAHHYESRWLDTFPVT